MREFLNKITDNHFSTRTESYTYTPAGRLLTATSGIWSNLAWTYDAARVPPDAEHRATRTHAI